MLVLFILEILLLYNHKRNKKLRWEFPSNMKLIQLTAAARTTGRDLDERKKVTTLAKELGLGTKYFQCKN